MTITYAIAGWWLQQKPDDQEYGKCNQELESVEGTGKLASILGGATFERLLIMAQQALSFLSWLGHNPNSTPSDVPSNEDVKDTSSICTPTSPGRQTELYQFAIDDIEGVECYYGLMYDLKSARVLFAAKTKDGIRVGISNWETFIKAKGARSAVEKMDEDLKELASKYGLAWDERLDTTDVLENGRK
ncbi:hypothetical protein I7I51_03214 [Histoplasma capsulatum]|uniref:Uncharacterized protein n=1 Tax=Ajellomyces capsulatus TaxID=5037 RepID=A0A8A1MQP7_AJECA|nr:predicted protein [Histoplasma mississippiense (nom. inval.)]EDN11064.1 predicted protein [Histoplasma mississippiense (nom. inval.)]QSS67002.1 hypothetical protein I7I51_03214 [Histoplasma capsulatum]